MKLRNKKTGEIMPASNIAVGIGKDGKWYDSLAELNEEWEDYEDVMKEQEWWYVKSLGEVRKGSGWIQDKNTKKFKELGNCFETKEEAEKTVEKIKAWKRLKDKGFRFKDWYASGYPGEFSIYCEGKHLDSDDIQKDLDLLFGGEE